MGDSESMHHPENQNIIAYKEISVGIIQVNALNVIYNDKS